MRAQSVAGRRISGCAGKHRFGSFEQARRVAHRQAHRRGEKFGPYACQDCGGFHVGSTLGTSGHIPMNELQPYVVFARRSAESEEIPVGRSRTADGGRVAEIIRADGWKVTRITKVKP